MLFHRLPSLWAGLPNTGVPGSACIQIHTENRGYFIPPRHFLFRRPVSYSALINWLTSALETPYSHFDNQSTNAAFFSPGAGLCDPENPHPPATTSTTDASPMPAAVPAANS